MVFSLIHGSQYEWFVDGAGEEDLCLQNSGQMRERDVMIFPLITFFHRSLSFIPHRLKLSYDSCLFVLLLIDFYKLSNVKYNCPTVVVW